MTAPVRVYVAAPFTEWKLVREVQAELRRRGAVITCDWTAQADSAPEGITDADVDEEEAREAAGADIYGVLSCDAFLSLTVADKSKGCGQWAELGAAIALNHWISDGENPPHVQPYRNIVYKPRCRIAICGPQRDRTIFSRFGRRFPNWQDSLPYVLGE